MTGPSTMTVGSLMDLLERKIVKRDTPVYVIYNEVDEKSFSGLVCIRQYTINKKSSETCLCIRPGFPLVPDERSLLLELATDVLEREMSRVDQQNNKPRRKRAKKGA